ncbi:hypothetical protein KKC45_01360 [Patescibacteria group bacterium]|nr:hypothetical protein [Patescibacteria group bacterium]
MVTANIAYMKRIRDLILGALPPDGRKEQAITLKEISTKTGLRKKTVLVIIKDLGDVVHLFPSSEEEPDRYCKSSLV